MIGYHYTTNSRWLKIKKQGLIPYKIDNRELDFLAKEPFFGIWVWAEKLTGKSHLGTILDRAIRKKNTRIVLLKVNYKKRDVLRKIGFDTISCEHSGTIGNWCYHKKEKIALVLKRIPPKDIELIKIYDLVKLTT